MKKEFPIFLSKLIQMKTKDILLLIDSITLQLSFNRQNLFLLNSSNFFKNLFLILEESFDEQILLIILKILTRFSKIGYTIEYSIYSFIFKKCLTSTLNVSKSTFTLLYSLIFYQECAKKFQELNLIELINITLKGKIEQSSINLFISKLYQK